MKIAVLTLMDDSNLGNRLQNYAVQQMLRKKGHDVTTLYTAFQYYNILSANGIKGAIHDFLLKSGIRSSHFYTTYLKRDKKLFRGLEFTKKHIKTSKKYLYKFKHHKMDKFKNDFDMWCVGSDQIWNASAVQNNSELFLTFAESRKTFSVSASFGNTDIEEVYIDNYVNGLKHLGNISVREFDGQQLVKRLTGRTAELLLDPTMMLNREEWLEVGSKPQNIGERKYVLTYFLGGMTETQQNHIQQYAREHELEIVDVEDYTNCVGPSEFVWLVNGAEFVFTDSFHGCAFSTIFRKAFIAFNRKNYGYDMSSRITTLLNVFGLEMNYTREIDEDYFDFLKKVESVKQQDLICIDVTMKEQQRKYNNYLDRALERN